MLNSTHIDPVPDIGRYPVCSLRGWPQSLYGYWRRGHTYTVNFLRTQLKATHLLLLKCSPLLSTPHSLSLSPFTPRAFPTMSPDSEEWHWCVLGVNHHVRDSLIFTLFWVMEEAKLLKNPINTGAARHMLRCGIARRIRGMPSQVQNLMFHDPDQCLDSLVRIALICKNTDSRLWKYYKMTATRMLHDEKVILVAPDYRKLTGFYLSKFLSHKRGLYREDKAIDERHLSYELFLTELVDFCGYNSSIHDISLWHEEPGSQARPEDANAVYDHETWISSMIEEQNVLQSSRKPLVFHIAELNSTSTLASR